MAKTLRNQAAIRYPAILLTAQKRARGTGSRKADSTMTMAAPSIPTALNSSAWNRQKLKMSSVANIRNVQTTWANGYILSKRGEANVNTAIAPNSNAISRDQAWAFVRVASAYRIESRAQRMDTHFDKVRYTSY